MSFSARYASGMKKIAGTHDSLIYELHGKVDSKSVWYIVKVNPKQHAALKKKLALAASMDLSEYGEILHSGWGDGPDEATRKRVKEAYGL